MTQSYNPQLASHGALALEIAEGEDDFGGDFGEHAATAMALAQYRCTRCGIDLSAPELRRFLHVHHRGVVKYDNPLSELVVLCIGCHANQPGHELMRALLDFSEFSVLARG